MLPRVAESDAERLSVQLSKKTDPQSHEISKCLFCFSCDPNLMSHQVLVESLDYRLAHVGFYAHRDVSQTTEPSVV